MSGELWSLDGWTLLVILAMALVTYATRVAGVVLVRFIPVRGRVAAALEAIPGSVLIALIAPMVLATGIAETAAAVLTLAVAFRGPPILAILTGVIAVVALRAAGL
ncbi:MAG: AzlD domain-containing protein [Rhodospirillaceae bacterium]|nr:AzlD domain-containing protein [Rhodospirillaceae bacterium]MCA8932137.1 AzlD domain-containing protein [Rhodospirillaceae bacterium]